MRGLDLNKPVKYKFASLRFFDENEHHINRVCYDDVLLLVFDGCLRFEEDNVEYEVFAGEYFIQQAGSAQRGNFPSDAPKYLYVHFAGTWAEGQSCLPKRGTFSYDNMKHLIYDCDRLCHSNALLYKKLGNFYQILSELIAPPAPSGLGNDIAQYIREHYAAKLSLDDIAAEFHFSKNHIINIFKNVYGVSPIAYLNSYRLRQAEYLLTVTSLPSAQIAEMCGFNEYSHFYRQFFKKNNAAPSDWRIKQRIKPI